MDALALPVRTRRSSTGLTLLPGATPPPAAPAPVGTAPQFDPAQRYDAAGRPDVHGGSSANFRASLAADRALAPAHAALQAQRDTLMADADRAAPPTLTGGTQTLTGTRPDGTTFTREVRQTAESPQVKEARSRALSLSLSPDDVAAGEQAFASSLAGSKATFDATHLPPADPRATVANALAGKYDKEGDAAKTRAENDTTRARSTVTLNDAHSKYWGTLGEAAQTKAKADAQAAIAKGDLDAAIKILTGEKTTTERDTRPGKVQGLTVKNQAADDANNRANLRLPYQQYADVTRGLHQSLNPVTGEPIAGAPQPPASFPQAGTASQPLALAPQPTTPPGGTAAATTPTLYANAAPANPAAPAIPTLHGPAPSQPASPVSAGGGIARVTSAAEWAALPSGAQFYDPAGHLRTKR